MPFFKKLKEIFGDRQGAAAKRVRYLVKQNCDWPAIEQDVFPDGGVGAPMSSVISAIIEAKNWKLLTPIVTRAGDYLDVIDLVYRKGEFGKVPAGRVQELEDIYNAISKAAPKNAAKVMQSFMTCVENWACLHDSEACYDWAKSKSEFMPVPAAGLVALADHPVKGSKLAMKVLATPADIDRAVDAVEWFYADKAHDRDDALENLVVWRKELEENEKKKKPPAPPAPKP